MEQWICSNNLTKKCSCYSSCNNISIKKETMKQCTRCNKINPAEIHTCTPWIYNKDWEHIKTLELLTK